MFMDVTKVHQNGIHQCDNDRDYQMHKFQLYS